MPSLSGDEASFVAAVVAGTGLQNAVVTAWVACESGWGTSKPGSNYLNIGPGRSYPSVSAAAAATVQQITTSPNYTGIVAAAATANGGAQIAAIKASPWDAGHYSNGCLDSAYASLGGSSATAVSDTSANTTGIITDGILGPLGSLLFGNSSSILSGVIEIGLIVTFSIAAFALMALGLQRLTGQDRSEVVQAVTSAATVAAA